MAINVTLPPTTSAPDVVPSLSSGGNISLYHPISIPTGSPNLTLDLDFVLSSPVSFTTRDSFSFSLQNSAGTASLFSLNFTPAIDGSSNDDVTTTVGTAANQSTSSAVTLSSSYHLHLVVTSGANGTYAVKITDPSSGSSYAAFNGSLSTSTITLANVARFAAGWQLAGAAGSNGYTNAGDNTLAFDNLVIVPEPSTWTMMALGLVGLLGVSRYRRRA